MLMLDDLSVREALSRLGASESAKVLLPALLEMPLSSAADLGQVEGREASGIYPRLWELQGFGLVSSHSLGASRGKVNRWWVTEAGLEVLGLGGIAWQQPWALGQLLGRLPAVEWFYEAAASVQGMGVLQSFQWFTGASWDAAARYQKGWAVFFWSGLLQVERRLREVIGELPAHLREYSVDGGTGWPGLLVFVAADPWQQELVLQVARSFGLEGIVQVWCATNGSVLGARSGAPGGGWVYQNPEARDLGGWGWQARLEGSLWSRGTGVGSNRLLSLAAEWPGMRSPFARQCFRESGDSKYVLRLLRQLVAFGLVDKEGDRGGRFRVNTRGYWLLSSRDRVSSAQMLNGVRGHVGASARRMALHEDGVMAAMGGFAEGGLPVAAGWRWWEGFPGGSIMADAMVYVSEGPFGSGWHYFEYERYARGNYRATRKLKGYLSQDRAESWPLLLVVWNQDVERVFHELGQRGGLLMLTTTMDRLRRYGPAGNSECWSLYGRPVYLGNWSG